MILGYDVSNVNGVVPRPAATEELKFRIAKATEGVGFNDRLFPGNRAAARQLGELFGAYHFLHRGDGTTQARHFVNYVRASGGFSGIGAFLDVELQDPTTGPSLGDVLAFGAMFKRLVPGKPLVIYTGGWYWRGHLGNPTGLARVPLWDSNYTRGSGTPLEIAQHVTPGYFTPYGGWTSRVIRQYSSSAVVAGHHPIDVDEIEIPLEELKAKLGITAPPVVRPSAQPSRPNPYGRPFTQLVLTGHLDRATIDALQWWIGVHRDGISSVTTTKALQRKIGAHETGGMWGTGTTVTLKRYLNRYARRWWNPSLHVDTTLDTLTVKTLQRYLNKLAGY